jgi:transposase InsO family protein
MPESQPRNYKLYPKFKVSMHQHDRWRKMAEGRGLSREAKLHLEWIIYYLGKAKKNASLTCRHFGIAPKTFYKWLNRFDEKNLGLLEDKSRAPQKCREKEYTFEQYQRIINLRRENLRYGKNKLLVIYQNLYPEDKDISAWKIQCMIKKSGIYFKPAKQARINRKRQLSQKRKKITELKKKHYAGFLLCVDTVVVYWNGLKRYILTAIDRNSKVAFARMYTGHSSYKAKDFLNRLYYLLDGKIENIQTDNGSEFHKYFDQTCQKLNIPHYYSRTHTPKDNAVNERFNKTLREEFLDMGNLTYDTKLFNQNLTEGLIKYNFHRPHQTLDYKPPINFSYKYQKVLPMYPSSTQI